MTATLPANAELSTVRMWIDQPKMHGWHRFLLIERPGARKVQLLHLVHLTLLTWPSSALPRAVRRAPVEPRELSHLLRRRRKDLTHHRRRFAGGLVGAVIARLHDQRKQAQQLDLEDLLEARNAA